MTTTAGSAGGIAPIAFEPHMLEADKPSDEIIQRKWGLLARVDPSVTFEEYQYWAKVERAEEREDNQLFIQQRGPRSVKNILMGRFSKGVHHEDKKRAEQATATQLAAVRGEKGDGAKLNESELARVQENPARVSDEEWKTASRALRTASWGTVSIRSRGPHLIT
jgi:hypothetical protein